MMKFSVIKNELHNLTRQQLRRVDGEMTALSARIKVRFTLNLPCLSLTALIY